MPIDFQDLQRSPTAVYEEGLRFFRGGGRTNDTLRRLVTDLNTYGIDYSVIGAVALNQHGYRRFTEDIDLLMFSEGLHKFQKDLVGRGYQPVFLGATKKFRQTEQNVPIEIIVSGKYLELYGEVARPWHRIPKSRTKVNLPLPIF